MKKITVITLLVIALLSSACSLTFLGQEVVRGSGNVAQESREVSDFTGVELVGSAEVEVGFGESESVVVEADDNLLPLVETRVRGGVLVISMKPNLSITTQHPVRVRVTMKELDLAAIPGSGSIEITGLQAEQARFELAGSGTIRADGQVEDLDVILAGSGDLECEDLRSGSVSVRLSGSGTVEVFAEDELDVSIPGSGVVSYRGEPESVRKTVTGSGRLVAKR